MEIYVLLFLAVMFCIAAGICVIDNRKVIGLICGMTSLSLVSAITIAVGSWSFL